MGLPDGPKSFKIGLVVLIQYRLWQTATQPRTSLPPSHVAVAIRLYASRRAQKMLNSPDEFPSVVSPMYSCQIFGLQLKFGDGAKLGFEGMLYRNGMVLPPG